MSRGYELQVETTGINEEQLKAVCEGFGWDGETETIDDTVSFTGQGSLSGGMFESEAHQQIYDELKKINPQAKVKTKWTCLDNLPFEEYGDGID